MRTVSVAEIAAQSRQDEVVRAVIEIVKQGVKPGPEDLEYDTVINYLELPAPAEGNASSPRVGEGARERVTEPPSRVSPPKGVGGDNLPPALGIKEEAVPEPDADLHQDAGVGALGPGEEEGVPDQQPLDEPLDPPPAAPGDGGAGNANLQAHLLRVPQDPGPQVDQGSSFDRETLHRAVQFRGSCNETARRGRRRREGSPRATPCRPVSTRRGTKWTPCQHWAGGRRSMCPVS